MSKIGGFVMAIDEKVLNDKVASGQALTKEEETAVLQDEGPVDGYAKEDIQDMKPEDFDSEQETDVQDKDDAATDDTAGTKKAEAVKDETKDGKVAKKEDPAGTPVKEDVFVKLERELAKEEGKEDLKSFSDREKAYFHQMRRDRKRAQRAEADLDTERRQRLKQKQDQEAESKKEDEPDPLEDLKKKDPTEFLTVAEAVSILEKATAKKATEQKKEEPDNKSGVDLKTVRYLEMCEKEARATHTEDFDIVME